MAAEIVTNIIAIVIVILLIVSLRLAKKPKHLILGGILILYSGISILSHYGVIGYSVPDLPIITYIISIVVTVGGASLVLDSFKEKSFLKWFSLIFGIVAIVLSVIPTLHEINAITFEIPSYPKFINFYLYFSAGFLLIIAAFIVKNDALKLDLSKIKLR